MGIVLLWLDTLTPKLIPLAQTAIVQIAFDPRPSVKRALCCTIFGPDFPLLMDAVTKRNENKRSAFFKAISIYASNIQIWGMRKGAPVCFYTSGMSSKVPNHPGKHSDPPETRKCNTPSGQSFTPRLPPNGQCP